MSTDLLVLLYLLYGFTFILMGVYAIKEYRKAYSVFPVVNALFYLGLFGIMHGISEWLTMFRHAGAFLEYSVALFYVGRILKAISFLALIQFGMVLILRPSWRRVSAIILTLYFILFVGYLTHIMVSLGMDHLYNNPLFLTVTLRYFMALPGAIISMIVLFYQGVKVRSLDLIWMRYYFYLGTVIFIYGLLDGLFVRQADFFPANVLYGQWFYNTLNIPIQSLKIVIGALIFMGVHFIVKSFTWEKERKWTTLKKHQRNQSDQTLFYQKVHDDLIQNLFISGLKLDSLKHESSEPHTKKELSQAARIIDGTIETLRDFLRDSYEKGLSLEAFEDTIQTFIHKIETTAPFTIHYHNYLDHQGLHNLDSALLEDMVYILQELLMNALKHAEATRVNIVMYQEIQCVKILVSDDGKGFNKATLNTSEKMGLHLIHSRIEARGGAVKIYTRQKRFWLKSGTTVSALIPLEASL